MQKKLDSYKGILTPKQIAEGMNAAALNARRLADDAKLLHEANRFPSAVSMGILSIEESGKTSILRSLSVARTEKELAEAWKDYRSHTKKNFMWPIQQLVADGARKLEDFRPLVDKSADHPFLLDQLKQIGFYTDCLGAAHWSVPTQVIDEGLSSLIVTTANLIAPDKEFTELEIELWVQYLGPVWNQDMALMKKAISDWYLAMQTHGLAPDGPNKMARFVDHDL